MCMFAKYNFKTPIFMCEITTFTFTLYKTVRSMLDKKNKNKTYKHIKISNVPVPCYVYKVICYTHGTSVVSISYLLPQSFYYASEIKKIKRLS